MDWIFVPSVMLFLNKNVKCESIWSCIWKSLSKILYWTRLSFWWFWMYLIWRHVVLCLHLPDVNCWIYWTLWLRSWHSCFMFGRSHSKFLPKDGLSLTEGFCDFPLFLQTDAMIVPHGRLWPLLHSLELLYSLIVSFSCIAWATDSVIKNHNNKETSFWVEVFAVLMVKITVS